MLCLQGPYGDFFIEVLAEILARFPDVDVLHDGAERRDADRRDARAEIPVANIDDPAFRRHRHCADRRMESLVRRMQARLKGIKPDAALAPGPPTPAAGGTSSASRATCPPG